MAARVGHEGTRGTTATPLRIEAPEAVTSFAAFATGTIADRFAEQVRRRPGALALGDGDVQWTYADLDRHSARVARAVLARIGTAPALVGVLLDHSAAAVAAIMGVIRSGHAFVALDPKHPTEWLRQQIDRLGPSLVLTAPERVDAAARAAPPGLPVIGVELDDATGSDTGADPLEVEIDPDTPAAIISTSGSTGEPKGVIKTHAGLLHSAWHYIDAAAITPDDRFSLLAPVGFMASIPPMLSAFLTGGSLFPFVVRDHGVEALIDWIEARRITVYDSVPTLFRRVARAVKDPARLASIRLVRLGGETIRPSDVRLVREILPGASVQIFLGSSEASMISQNVITPGDPIPEGLMPLGRPVDGIEVMFVDEDGAEVERGQPGRMIVRGRPVSPGYWRDPEATAAGFRTDPLDSSIRTYRMPDIGRWRPDGMLEHLGRTEEFAKVRGTRVSPAVSESALADLPGVRDAAVVARADEDGEERLVAYVVLQPGHSVTPGGLRQALRGKIPEAMIPGAFVVMNALPLTANGKVDRKSLPPPRPVSRPPYRQPRDAIEWAVAREWEELLGVERVGLDDRFRDLGGTSLDGVQLLLRLEQIMSRRLPDSIMADHDRLEDLAAAVAREDVASGPLVPHKTTGTKRPFFCVHPANGMAGFYGPLARAIDPERPFYAIQSPGLTGEWPLPSIGAMAERYIAEIRAVDARGPYLIGGLCTGGLVAWEMAQRLTAAGSPVALVVLIETWRRSFGRHESVLRRAGFVARHAARRLRWRVRVARAGKAGLAPAMWPAWRQFVNYMNEAATRRYRARPYAGRVAVILAADEPAAGPVDERLAMRDLVRGPVEVAVAPGTHADVCHGAHVGTLAATLRRMLDAAEQEVRG